MSNNRNVLGLIFSNIVPSIKDRFRQKQQNNKNLQKMHLRRLKHSYISVIAQEKEQSLRLCNRKG